MPDLASRQVDWFTVHQFVVPLLARITTWPAAGTPEWANLPDADPRKLAAVIDAGRRHALRIDTEQEALAQASRDISRSLDCRALALDVRNHQAIRIRRHAS